MLQRETLFHPTNIFLSVCCQFILFRGVILNYVNCRNSLIHFNILNKLEYTRIIGMALSLSTILVAMKMLTTAPFTPPSRNLANTHTNNILTRKDLYFCSQK